MPKPEQPLSRREALHLGGATLTVGLASGCSTERARTTTMTSTASTIDASTTTPAHPPRAIIGRTRGHAGGPITRLVSPSDLGRLIKPFVFLDLFDASVGSGHAPSLESGWHPHSGIATVTVVIDGEVKYAETTGNAGTLPAGGVEWMRAGGGVWHTGTFSSTRTRGFQLWVALPPELENAANESRYLLAEQVPTSGPVRVVLGSYGGLTSPIPAPPMTYLWVTLKDGEAWTFTPSVGQDVAWVSLMDGAVRTPTRVTRGEIAIFEQAEAPIHFVAEGDTTFVLGAAQRHPHDLVLGNYSVHTNSAALERGETEIRRVGRQLTAAGKQSYALRLFG